MSVLSARRAPVLGASLVVLLALAVVPARAQFSVDKTRVMLTGRAQSSLVRVTNDSGEAMRFDVKVFAWDHGEDGQERLVATSEAVAAPGTFTLAAKQSQNIRVGSTATVGVRERAFRLLIEELPQARSASAGASVAMRMRLSIPVFLEPAKGEARLDLGVPTMTKLLPAVMASNTGSVHLQIDSVKFRGVSASGREAFAMSEGGGYVLPGKSVRLTLPAPLTSAQCRDTARLFVEVAVHGDVVTHDAPVTSAACGG